ncbi:hypothetical protein ANO11243_042960 [Dothideomycetidae sp. 11243]|nr:hypothetical protein ANO11243_042960 [fungal sp. No.11243]
MPGQRQMLQRAAKNSIKNDGYAAAVDDSDSPASSDPVSTASCNVQSGNSQSGAPDRSSETGLDYSKSMQRKARAGRTFSRASSNTVPLTFTPTQMLDHLHGDFITGYPLLYLMVSADTPSDNASYQWISDEFELRGKPAIDVQTLRQRKREAMKLWAVDCRVSRKEARRRFDAIRQDPYTHNEGPNPLDRYGPIAAIDTALAAPPPATATSTPASRTERHESTSPTTGGAPSGAPGEATGEAFSEASRSPRLGASRSPPRAATPPTIRGAASAAPIETLSSAKRGKKRAASRSPDRDDTRVAKRAAASVATSDAPDQTASWRAGSPPDTAMLTPVPAPRRPADTTPDYRASFTAYHHVADDDLMPVLGAYDEVLQRAVVPALQPAVGDADYWEGMPATRLFGNELLEEMRADAESTA